MPAADQIPRSGPCRSTWVLRLGSLPISTSRQRWPRGTPVPQGLEQCLLGGETRGKVARGVALGLAVGDLSGREEIVPDGRAFHAKLRLHARNLEHVVADTDDHGSEPSCEGLN